MNRRMYAVLRAGVILFVFGLADVTILPGGVSACAESAQTQKKTQQTDPVASLLDQLNKKTSALTSFECQIEYKYSQPLLESQRLSKGTLYYSRSGKTSAMRINFDTLRQDEEKERKYLEQYIVLDGAKLSSPGREFRGIWLVHLDYQVEEAKYYQLVEPNEPNDSPDVFELVGRELPMIGFSKIKDLKKQFEISLVSQKGDSAKDFTQVHLEVKPNSIYKDDFVSIDFWIDKKLGLPARIVAVKTEPEPPYGEIEEIKLLKPKVNKGIDRSVYEFKIPGSFGEPEITPLSKKNKHQ